MLISWAAFAFFMRMAKYIPAGPPPMMLIFMRTVDRVPGPIVRRRRQTPLAQRTGRYESAAAIRSIYREPQPRRSRELVHRRVHLRGRASIAEMKSCRLWIAQPAIPRVNH